MASTDRNTTSSAATAGRKPGRPRKVTNIPPLNTQTTHRVSKKQITMQMSEALAQKQKKIEQLVEMMNTLATRHKMLHGYAKRQYLQLHRFRNAMNIQSIKHKMLYEYTRQQALQLQRFRQLSAARIATTRAAMMAQRVHVQPAVPRQ